MTTFERTSAVSILLGILAAYRVTRLIVEDQITEPVRSKIWDRFNPEETRLGYLLTCVHCSSVWVALALAIAPRRLQPLIWALGVAGAVSLINDARAAMDVIH